MSVPARAAAALTGALAAFSGYAASRRLAGVSERFDRTNHAGRTVTLLEGPAYAAGAALAAGISGAAGPVAALGAAGFGAVDDHFGDSRSKGLRGHLAALTRGRMTTGVVKILGLAATGTCAAGLAHMGRTAAPTDRPLLRIADLAADGALIAGTANLVNLLDLRPGRALKATILAATPLALGDGPAGVVAAAAIGAAAGVIGPDLRGEAMLGDTGANAAGALVGVAAVGALGRTGRLAVLAGIIGLTLVSERVSFTKVIESTPVLRELDAWGRERR